MLYDLLIFVKKIQNYNLKNKLYYFSEKHNLRGILLL